MKAMHLIIAMLVMMSLASCLQMVMTPLKTQFQRISWKKRMEPEALHTRKTILTS